MRLSPKLRPSFWDVLVVLAVVALAVGTAVLTWQGGHSEGPLTAVISVDGVQVEAVSLEEEAVHTIHANGYMLEIAVENGEVWMTSSDCPTQDCVHTGHISRGGQSIVCLPARVIVTVEGAPDNAGGPDIVIG